MNSVFGDRLHIVVARYKEPLEWLNHEPFNLFTVTIYNKGGDDNYVKAPNIVKEIVLPNSGLDAHSFLYHIINNYDNLANITAFFQGSIDLPCKYQRSIYTIIESFNRDTTILANAAYEWENLTEHLYDFTIDEYPMSHPTVGVCEHNYRTYPCSIRPFGKWYDELFGDIKIRKMAFNHIMAVKREHILRRPKEFYQKLISFVENIEIGRQPEVVHYFERSWAAIFHPLDNNYNFV
jgi:hypothetical protein